MSSINLLTPLLDFHTAEPAQSTLTVQKPRAEFRLPASASQGFTVRFTLNPKVFPGDRRILEIPGLLEVRLSQHDPGDRNRQNYPAYKIPDGSVPVLEANVVLHSPEHPDWRDMTIGFPLAMLKSREDRHEVVLHFTCAHWTMYVDGELVDQDFPFGYPQWTDGSAWAIDAEYVKEAALYVPAIRPEARPAPKRQTAPIQYWTPPGHNSWVGDIATCFHGGRYHIFYLYDRRHHQSRFGTGGHYFEHLSTMDFKTWTEHEAATPIDEQWEAIGTGAPFVFEDQFCLSYGLHTARLYPDEQTSLPAQWEYLRENGCTRGFSRATTPGVPAGATYAICEDGISKFRKTGIMSHPSQNPMLYTDPDGKLRMLANYGARGIWESDRVDGGWRCVSPEFPPGFDCTFFFRWGQFDYIIGGFTCLWSKPADAPDSAYQDLVQQGIDFYDGSNVPAITEIPGNRFLMAAWAPIRGWGGCLLIRELLQLSDGRIGSKWMNEIAPEAAEPQTLARNISDFAEYPAFGGSFMLTFDVGLSEEQRGRIGVLFLPEDGCKDACELQISPGNRRAQFATGSPGSFGDTQKTLREGAKPHEAGDYAIENLIDVDRPFAVRVIVKANEKIGGSLIDVEIAGCRTVISYRPDLAVKRIAFRQEGAEIADIQIASLVHE